MGALWVSFGKMHCLPGSVFPIPLGSARFWLGRVEVAEGDQPRETR